jgi:hypothetical protein
MRTFKHLPVADWPDVDRTVFEVAFAPGDVFEQTGGPGAHLSEPTCRMIRFAYRRWLGFLKEHHPDDLSMEPAARITLVRVRAYIEHLSAQMRPSSIAIAGAHLYAAARLIAPTTEWSWLRSIKSRLASRAKPQDRFDRLVPPWQTLDFGIELMDAALTLPASRNKQREIQYRDGLFLTLISLWPMRRRSITALTVTRHLEFDDAGINILLHSCDTKAGRAESSRVPEEIVPYLVRYLNEIRCVLVSRRTHDGLWASLRGCPLSADRLYSIARARIFAKFGKAMSLHDFRRAAATFLAMDAPEKIGLIPGVLQHASPEVNEQHYNLSRSFQAGQRFAAHLTNAKNRLRPLTTKSSTVHALQLTP